MNSLEKYLKNIEEIKVSLDSMPLETEEGTKRMKEKFRKQAMLEKNNILTELVSKYENDLEKITLALKNKKDEMIPKKQSALIKKKMDETLRLEKAERYSNPFNEYTDKTNFMSLIYEMDNADNSNLSTVNAILTHVINKFRAANVPVKPEDFNYTIYTKKYMEYFFEKLGTKNFDYEMGEKFDEIYWSAPNLLTHIKLNVYSIAKKYEKELTEYSNSKKDRLFEETKVTEDNVTDKFKASKKELDYLTQTDVFNNIMLFLEDKEKIDVFLESSDFKIKTLSNFSYASDFTHDHVTDKFLEEIIEISDAILEAEGYNKFEFILKDIVSRYNEFSKAKGLTKNKLKEITKLEKEKDSKVSKFLKLENSGKSDSGKLFGLLGRGPEAKREKTLNKLNKLSTEINAQVDELNILYNELEDARINEKISEFINEESTIYDAALLANSFYNYIKNLIQHEKKFEDVKDLDEMVNAFNDYVYNPNNVIINKFNLFEEYDFEELIRNKYKLYKMKVSEDFLNKNAELKERISYASRLYYLRKSKITADDIKFIYTVNKL